MTTKSLQSKYFSFSHLPVCMSTLVLTELQEHVFDNYCADKSGQGLDSSIKIMVYLTIMPSGLELCWTSFGCGCPRRPYWTSPALSTMSFNLYNTPKFTIHYHQWLNKKLHGQRMTMVMYNLEAKLGNSTIFSLTIWSDHRCTRYHACI